MSGKPEGRFSARRPSQIIQQESLNHLVVSPLLGRGKSGLQMYGSRMAGVSLGGAREDRAHGRDMQPGATLGGNGHDPVAASPFADESKSIFGGGGAAAASMGAAAGLRGSALGADDEEDGTRGKKPDPLFAPSEEDLLMVVDDAINVFPDFGDASGDEHEEVGEGSGQPSKDLVRLLPAVKYQYDNLLNLLDIYSLAVAFASLLAVLAVHVERQIDPLGGYNMSLEGGATAVVIGSNSLLLVYALYSFRKDFR